MYDQISRFKAVTPPLLPLLLAFNRQKDFRDGRFAQLTSSTLDTKLREDLERLKKIRCATHPLGLLEMFDVPLGHSG